MHTHSRLKKTTLYGKPLSPAPAMADNSYGQVSVSQETRTKLTPKRPKS